MATLTRQQLNALASQATALAEWTTVRDFAHQMYDEDKAVKVEIETYGEYDDEGGTDYCIEAITVTDKDGNELKEFDHSRPFFASKAWQESVTRYKGSYESDFKRLKDLYMPDEEKQRAGWILIEDLPTPKDDVTYDLTVPPQLALPV